MCIWSISGCAIDLLRNLWYCVPFPARCNWQLVAKSTKMFNKAHVLSFLALPLYPCGSEPATDTMPPPVQCNFAWVLCARVCMCVASSTFHSLSHSKVSWRNLCRAAQNNVKLSFKRGGEKPTIFFVEGEDASLLWGHPSREGEGRLNESHKCQCSSTNAEVGQKVRTACCATWYLSHLWCCHRLLNASCNN